MVRRGALHVHQAGSGASPGGDGRQARVRGEAGDVVDQRRARRQGRLGDGSLAGVDGQGHVGLRAQALQDGEDAAQLLLLRHFRRARASGLPAHVHHVCPGDGQREAVRDGFLHRGKAAPVREAVGRHVEDAHEVRSLSPDEAAASQVHRLGTGVDGQRPLQRLSQRLQFRSRARGLDEADQLVPSAGEQGRSRPEGLLA